MGAAEGRNKTTSSLSRHLLIPQHRDILAEIKATSKQNEVNDMEDSADLDGQEIREELHKRLNKQDRVKLHQLTIPDHIEKTKKWNEDHAEAKKLHRLLFEMLILDDQPWTLVEKIGFTR